MKSRALVAALAVSSLATLTTGCMAQATDDPFGDPAADQIEEVESTSEALAIGGGGASAGYSCTDAGACTCRGLADCNDMFIICKSHTYCNYDEQGGFRCICWNFSVRTGVTPVESPVPGATLELAR